MDVHAKASSSQRALHTVPGTCSKQRSMTLVHALERDVSRLPPPEFSPRVHIANLYDAHRGEATVELGMSQKFATPRLAVPKGFLAQECGEVVVRLRVARVVVALVSESFFLREDHPKRNHGEQELHTLGSLGLGGPDPVRERILGHLEVAVAARAVRRDDTPRTVARRSSAPPGDTRRAGDATDTRGRRRERRLGHHPSRAVLTVTPARACQRASSFRRR